MQKLSNDDIIKRLNTYIQKGIVTYDHRQDDSLTCAVFGLRQAESFGMTWKEIQGRFLGGGICESYGYSLIHNGQFIRGLSYMSSLRMFLNYIDKNLSNKPSYKGEKGYNHE